MWMCSWSVPQHPPITRRSSTVAKLVVVVGEVCDVAAVERCRAVELCVADRRGVRPHTTDASDRVDGGVELVDEVGGVGAVHHVVRDSPTWWFPTLRSGGGRFDTEFADAGAARQECPQHHRSTMPTDDLSSGSIA